MLYEVITNSVMFAIERIKIIKDYLTKDKHVSVAKLSRITSYNVCYTKLLRQRGERDVSFDVVDEDQARGFTIFGGICNAFCNRVADIPQIQFFAVLEDLAGDLCSVCFTEQAHCEFCASRAHQARDADHFALADVDVDVSDVV